MTARPLPTDLLRLASRLPSLALAVGLAALASGCGGGPGGPGGPGGRGGPPPEEVEDRPTPVLLATVERGTIEGKIRAASTIEAERQVTVHAESTGRISSMDLEEGDTVKAGQTLARVRRDAQSLGYERAEASLADAEREYERVDQLYRQGIASQSEYDQAKSQLDLARLDKRDRRRDLANTVAKAPFGGKLTQRFVDRGGFVTSGAQMFEITDFDSLVARVYVPERELDRIAVGQPAEVVGKAAQGRQGTGQVKRIAPIVDATTGTVKVTIGLPPELAGGAQGFLPGMYAEVTLTTEVHENVPLVPKPALVREEEQTFVFVVAGDKAEKTLIEVGLADDDFIEVVSGISDGARIVVAGQNGLEDGGSVVEVDTRGQPVDGAQAPESGDPGPPASPTSAVGEGVAKAG